MSPISSQAVETPHIQSQTVLPTLDINPDNAHLQQMAQQTKTDSCFSRNGATIDDAPPQAHPSFDLSHARTVETPIAARSESDSLVKEFANVTADMQRHAARLLSDIEGLIRVHRSGAEMLQCLMEMDAERAPSGNVPQTDQAGASPAPPSDLHSKRSVEFDRKVKEFSDAIESLKVLRQETPMTAPSAAQGLSSSSHPTDRSDSDRSGRYSPVETCQNTNGVNVTPGVLPHGKGSVSASRPTPREGNASEARG